MVLRHLTVRMFLDFVTSGYLFNLSWPQGRNHKSRQLTGLGLECREGSLQSPSQSIALNEYWQLLFVLWFLFFMEQPASFLDWCSRGGVNQHQAARRVLQSNMELPDSK